MGRKSHAETENRKSGREHQRWKVWRTSRKGREGFGGVDRSDPCRRKAKQTIRDFGIRQGESIACIVTLRKQNAIEFLGKVLPVIDKKIPRTSFDRQGNFSFGIKEHIEIKGVKYDPDVGIFGMDVCVSMARPGYRVKIRRREKAKIGSKHVLSPEESMAFAKNALGVEIV